MPTGYTAQVEDGTITEFADFAMLCARAFGACIMMRDDPLDAEIPAKFEPSKYHAEQIEKAQAALERYSKMSDKEAESLASAAFEDAVKEHKKSVARAMLEKERYAAMRKKVQAWEPPTTDHTELKKFMLNQIDISDRDTLDYYERYKPVKLSGKDWRAERIASAKKDIAYHTKEHDEETQRAADRTKWIAHLRKSLAEYTK